MPGIVRSLLVVAGFVAGSIALAQAAPALAQSTNKPPAPNVLPREAIVPPLQLSDSQRADIRAVLAKEQTGVSFGLKSAKSTESFEPKVGAKLETVRALQLRQRAVDGVRPLPPHRNRAPAAHAFGLLIERQRREDGPHTGSRRGRRLYGDFSLRSRACNRGRDTRRRF